MQEIIIKQRDLFGNGLNNDDLKNISKYIQVVEEKAVEEYDDFFMIPYWIDYLSNLDNK